MATSFESLSSREVMVGMIARIAGEDAAGLHDHTVLSSVRGWDSFTVLEITVGVDEELGIELNPEQVAACRTVGDLLLAVEAGRS
jgi:acyl carrier protein